MCHVNVRERHHHVHIFESLVSGQTWDGAIVCLTLCVGKKEEIIPRSSLGRSTVKGASTHPEADDQDFTSTNWCHPDEDGGDKGKSADKGVRDVKDKDLQRPYKEVLKSLFTSQPKENGRCRYLKERWTDEMSYIQDVPEVMQISTFMSNSMCLELARGFSDQVTKTVTEMMKRVDDFIKSEEVYMRTELSRGELPEKGQGVPSRVNRPPCAVYEEDIREQTTTITSITTKITTTRMFPLERIIEGKGEMQEKDNKGTTTTRGNAVQVMFEHCFDNLPSFVKARLTQTHTELVGISIEQLIPIGKIELEAAFGNKGLRRRTKTKFTVVRASSPCNIILGCIEMRNLQVVSSTIHTMIKFPTPRGIATLVARLATVFEF
nr:reverse transcriptase domain-containing protein [Tanacetum cinerariifolium]